MSNFTTGSGLFYYGTKIEVCLCDRVIMRRWFRAPLQGIVCYLPGASPHDADFEYDDVRQWAIRSDDGTIWAMGYDPANTYGQPSRSIEFVSRGVGG